VSGRYRLARTAEDDLFAIARYVYLKSRSARTAERLVRRIYAACSDLADLPSLGHSRKDLCPDPGLRFYCVSDIYLIVYEHETEPLQIVRILHGARDVAKELGGD
jgi:plasmid stabilization system protein ParE